MKWRQTLPKEDTVDGEVAAVVEHLHKKGYSRVGAIGFCWGGAPVVRGLQKGLIKAGVSLHGGLVSAESAALVKGPILYICSEVHLLLICLFAEI